MRFRKKNKPVCNLVEMLKQRPNEMFICDTYMAVWSPMLNRALIIPGNYMSLDEEAANEVLAEKIKTVLV